MDKNALVNAMVGQMTTNNWDVLCSYDEKSINDMLTNKYVQGSLVSDVNLSFTYHDDLFDEDVTINANLLLDAPCLNFQLGDKSRCLLTMPVASGKYTLSTPEKAVTTDIPANTINVTCIVPLAAMMGDTGSIQPSNSIISFDQGSTTSAHIILHFKNSNETIFDVSAVPGNETAASQLALMHPNIKPSVIQNITYLFQTQVSEIDYSVGGITNSQTSGQVTLIPKSFIFSASKPNADKNASLNLYIQTVTSGNPQGDAQPVFQPGGISMLPIPDGYTASLIISSNLLINTFIAPQCQALGWTTTSTKVTSGIQCNVASSKTVIVKGEHTMGRDQCNSDDVRIDFTKHPFILTIDKEKMQITWNFSQDVNWSEDIVTQTGDVVHDGGVIGVTASVNKTFPLTISSGDNLGFDFSVDQADFTVNTSMKSGIWPSFMSGSKIFQDGIQSQLGPSIGSFSFNLGSLNCFAMTNLLFPGQNVMDIDIKEGFHVPQDLILFGNIQTK